jgi:hypothetical protein
VLYEKEKDGHTLYRAFGILVAHVINAGWDAKPDALLLVAFGSLTVGLASAGIALFFQEAGKE